MTDEIKDPPPTDEEEEFKNFYYLGHISNYGKGCDIEHLLRQDLDNFEEPLDMSSDSEVEEPSPTYESLTYWPRIRPNEND